MHMRMNLTNTFGNWLIKSNHDIVGRGASQCDGDSNGDCQRHVTQHPPEVVWDQQRKKCRGDVVRLVRCADKDERRQNDVHDRVAGQQHEQAMRVGRQPDVILRHEQLHQHHPHSISIPLSSASSNE